MTSKVSIYHIPYSKQVNHLSTTPACINIIDTPGFGDTRGATWDQKIATMIGNLLKELMTLDYLMLVVKATDNRLAKSSKFVYQQIQGLYAKDLSERVVGLFTFSDGGEPKAYEGLKQADIPLKERNRFKFNNSAIWSTSGDELTKQFFDMGMDNFAEFVEFLRDNNADPISLRLT